MNGILWLSEPAAQSVASAGGKGASLARLVGWGLPVPPGFVVTTHATAALIAEAVQARRLTADIALPEPLADAIRAAYRELRGTVAVRSSATAEDSATASFAGQQDTYLDVEGESDVVERVGACIASLFNERALAYRSRMGVWEGMGIAVVVQRMVPAAKAGVLFTRDPVQARPRVVIEAVAGGGEALVSGEAVPDHYEVERADGSVASRFSPGRQAPVLSDDEITALFELGLRCEQLFGAPQDVEWAIADRLYLLQSRPITTL